MKIKYANDNVAGGGRRTSWTQTALAEPALKRDDNNLLAWAGMLARMTADERKLLLLLLRSEGSA
jgi:hypothetical protein